MTENKPALVPVESRPLNAETPLAVLADPITPTSLLYVRNHFDTPHIDERTWRLSLDGRVESAREFRLADLKSMGERTEAVTLECAGNGRTQLVPRPKGTPWGFGAVGTVQFTGVPLSLVLKRANPLPDAVEVLFLGADRGEVQRGRVEPFARSLPIDEARSSEALLAWEMNGKPLLPTHGFPLRLVFPDWYGVASVKWLTRISLLSEPFRGYFQSEQYIIEKEAGTPERTPVTRMRVRAIIAKPADGEKVERGKVEIAGSAWSGFGPIRSVEVSTDGGRSWQAADLKAPPSLHAATTWRFGWNAGTPGTYTLMARAIDKAGNVQPSKPLWNLHGYGNNGVHSVATVVT